MEPKLAVKKKAEPAGSESHRAGLVIVSRHAVEPAYVRGMIRTIAHGLGAMDISLGAAKAIMPGSKRLGAAILAMLPSADLIVVCGGTGISEDDVAPQVIEKLSDYPIPGIGELIRSRSLQFTIKSCFSRGGAWVKDRRLILALPGSPNAVAQHLSILRELIPMCLCALMSKCSSRKADRMKFRRPKEFRLE